MSNLRYLRASLVIAALGTSACMIHVASNPAPSEVGSGVHQSEYDVYFYMLRTIGTARFKTVADSTLRRTAREPAGCRNPEQSDCIPSSRSVQAAWHDFKEKNERRWLVEPRFPPDLGVTLQRDAQPSDSTCHAPTLIAFSRVGFDRDQSHAVVTMTVRTGKGPFPGCGGFSLMTVVLERVRNSWRRVAYIESLET
jgi:hypothetical protein